MACVRRGLAPAAPRPINLPSQKLENEAIPQTPPPRPPFSWGNPNAPAKNAEKTDQATIPLPSDEARDIDSNVMIISLSTVEVEGAVEQLCAVQSAEGSTSTPASVLESNITSPSSVALAGRTEVYPSSAGIGPCDSDTQGDTKAQVDTEMDSLPDGLAQLVSSGSATSLPCASLGPPDEEAPGALESAAKVEDQKLSNELFSSPVHSWAEECEKVSSPQPEEGERVSEFENGQGSNWSSKLKPEPRVSDCCGVLYGDSPPPSSCPGMPFVNCHAPTFGSGLYAGPFPCDGVYSSLGVPYYDSARNKEIVVITMVGNPGFYGNYFPSPVVPDQFVTNAGVYGNVPLQFGQFEHPIVSGPTYFEGGPQPSTGEQGECAYYEEDYLKHSWATNGHMLQTNGNGRMPTSFHPVPYSEGHGVLNGAGRQRPAYRARKATTKEAWKPERRVTLLTKGSQHELIIRSFEKRSKPGGGSWCAKKCDPECKGAELCGDHEVVDMDNSLASGASTSLTTADESSSPQPTPSEAKVVSSVLSASSKKDFGRSPVVSPTEGLSTFHAHDKDAVQPGLPSSRAGEDGSPLLTGQNPEVTNGIEERDVSKCHVMYVTCNVDSSSSMSSDHQQKCQPVNSTEEQAKNNAEVLNTTTVEMLLTKRTNGSVPRVSRTWRRKVSTAVAKLGREQVSDMVKEVAVVKKVATVKEVTVDEKDSPWLHPQVSGTHVLDAALTSASRSTPIPLSNLVSASVHCQASEEAKEDCHPALPMDCNENTDTKLLAAGFHTDPLGIVATLDSTHTSQKGASQSAKEQGGRTMNALKWVKEWRQKQPSAGVWSPITTATTVSDQLSGTNAALEVRKLQETAAQRAPSLCTCSDTQNRLKSLVLKACSSDGLSRKSKRQKSPLKGSSLATQEPKEQNCLSAVGTVDKNKLMMGESHLLQVPQPLQPVASKLEKEGLVISESRIEKKEQTSQIVKKQKSEKPQPGDKKHGKTGPPPATQVQLVHILESQASSGLILVPRPEDYPVAKPVKSGGHHTSWRPKAVCEKSGVKKVSNKEVQENDPQVLPQKEGRAKQQAEGLASGEFAESSDAQKGSKTSSGCDEAALHDRAQKKVLDSKGLRSPVAEREAKRAAGSMKQGGVVSSPKKNSGLYAKQSVYVAKQSDPNQQNLAGNDRRPFSTRPNFCFDENRALPPHDAHPPCTSAPLQQAQVKDSSCVGRETSSHVESRRDSKVARRGRFHGGWRASEQGWVIKREMMEIVV